MVFCNLFLSFYWYHNDLSIWNDQIQPHQPPGNTLLSPEAYPVYGIRADFTQQGRTISAFYASPKKSPKGTVLLLHACTHNALKFFAPSPTCPECIGLSEEMRLARIVLERGYTALAVTASSKGGCWGGDQDIRAIRGALNALSKDSKQSIDIVYALGASSGGAMAAKLVGEGVAESAAVMVMGLREQLLDTIISRKDGGKKLYLAPMTRDKGTTKRVRDNQAYWNKRKQQQPSTHEMIVDEVSCVPLPVTADYLWNRVPGMTHEAAQIIVDVLLQHKHLDPKTMKLIVDPTKSNWRDFFLKEKRRPFPKSLQANQNDSFLPKSNIDMLLWDTFDLTPGISPLAKSLHRAWAMHEYCSEIVETAIDFFEGRKAKEEVLAMLRQA